MADDAPPPPSAPLWIVSFGDMISNMVTFFILLAAFSTPSAADSDARTMGANTKEKGVFQSGKKRALVKKQTSNDAKSEVEGPEKTSRREEESSDRKLDNFVMNADYNVKPDLERLADGLRITLEGDRLFTPGSAALRSNATEIVVEIGKYFRGEPCDFVVEAHADGRSHRYSGDASPLDISRRMAVGVAAALRTAGGVPAYRIAIAPRGATEPVASDDEAVGRAKNRRVAILVRKSL